MMIDDHLYTVTVRVDGSPMPFGVHGSLTLRAARTLADRRRSQWAQVRGSRVVVEIWYRTGQRVDGLDSANEH